MKATFAICLLLVPLAHSDMQCEVKSGVNRAYNKVGDAAAQGIRMDGGRTLNNMQLFQCRCLTPNEIFDEDDVEAIHDEFSQHNWDKSQIFRIYNCDVLRLRLEVGSNTFSDYLSQKLLIIENIKELELPEFLAGKPDSQESTFSSIYFRNVTFYQVPNFLEFENRYEIVFENVKLGADALNDVTPFEIRVRNDNATMNPVLRIEGSEFPGVTSTTGNEIEQDMFILDVENVQFELDNSGDEECNYDYKGRTRLYNNKFGFLRSRNIFMKNGMELMMDGNFFETLHEEAFDIRNMKKTTVMNNHFGYLIREPIFYLLYTLRESSSCNRDDLPENKIEPMRFTGNRFDKLTAKFFDLDIDNDYSSSFVSNKFQMQVSEVSKPCNCTKPSEPELEAEKIHMELLTESRCLSDQKPPLFGKRADICNGIMPLTHEEIKNMAHEETKDAWTIYLVVAVFVTMLLTAIATFAAVKFCCNGDKDGTVSPRA